MGIKSEKNLPKKSCTLPNKNASISAGATTWTQDKQKLVGKIVGLQTENQRITFDLQKKMSECEALIQEKLNIEKELSEKVHTLTEEMNAIKLDCVTQKERDKETIAQLSYDNKTLQARIKQLQVGVRSQERLKSNQENASENVYEVERLINHKKKKNGMHYLVRWKNYTSKDDTWEHESDLMCPEILESYKQKMNL